MALVQDREKGGFLLKEPLLFFLLSLTEMKFFLALNLEF